MSEEPKSILKKTVSKRSWIFALFVALVGGTVVAVIAGLSGLFRHEVTALFVVWGAVVFLIWLVMVLIRWILSSGWRRVLFRFACLFTLIAFFYAEENWRGKKAWENYKRTWEAKGERFDFASIIPPPVADDRNFAMTPVVASCYGYILTRDGKKIPSEQRDTNHVNRLVFDLGDSDWETNATGHWINGSVSDLKLWQTRYRELAQKTNLFAVPPQPREPAADVLMALSKYDSTAEELRQAAQLPECRFPLDYDNECPAAILLPHLWELKSSGKLLQLRAIAELENNQNEKALADVLLSLRLTDFLRSEPTLISHLVRIAMTEIVVQPVYEGLAEHKWSDAQLCALEQEFAKVDYLMDYQSTMRWERAFTGAIIDYVRTKDRAKRYSELFDGRWDDDGNYKNEKNVLQAVGVFLMPSGWFDQNKLIIGQLHETWLLRLATPERHLVFPGATSQKPFNLATTTPFNLFAIEMIPSLTNSIKKFARGQLGIDLARTAIALERYRLKHGEFPGSLETLVPQFIANVPHDVFGGQPLKYRREADGTFTLYSIGWNEKDDGGVRMIPKGQSIPKFEEGDWVWRYPAKN